MACAGPGDPLNKTKHSKIQLLKGSQGTRQDMNNKQRESNKKETNNKTKTTTKVVFKANKKDSKKKARHGRQGGKAGNIKGSFFVFFKKGGAVLCVYLLFGLLDPPSPLRRGWGARGGWPVAWRFWGGGVGLHCVHRVGSGWGFVWCKEIFIAFCRVFAC